MIYIYMLPAYVVFVDNSLICMVTMAFPIALSLIKHTGIHEVDFGFQFPSDTFPSHSWLSLKLILIL